MMETFVVHDRVVERSDGTNQLRLAQENSFGKSDYSEKSSDYIRVLCSVLAKHPERS